MQRLPIPPFEMRQLVGPTDEAAFDNPTGELVFPEFGPSACEAILDFGCGCGRIARKLMQQRIRPKHYVGIDLHAGMVDWCQQNLSPVAPEFSFRHHDVYNLSFNPGPALPRMLPVPVRDRFASLVIAWSVFTHVTQDQLVHYLREVARVLRPDGVCVSTWFLFEKRFFPMMQDFQNALFINDVDVTNATIFDRQWLLGEIEAAGLQVVSAVPPMLRGYQWVLHLTPIGHGTPVADIGEDRAPFGRSPPPVPGRGPAS